jgi:hypothetical protein
MKPKAEEEDTADSGAGADEMKLKADEEGSLLY